ncbi:hypothetical protein K449DRAFT_435723 [Hypoxylon sp. EC38]|nr:hypothetical protein K449DRAFT_435723 [Hypoxylon sp. EC38]
MSVLFATLGINPVLVSSDGHLFGSKYNRILFVLENITMQQFLQEQPILCHNYQTDALDLLGKFLCFLTMIETVARPNQLIFDFSFGETHFGLKGLPVADHGPDISAPLRRVSKHARGTDVVFSWSQSRNITQGLRGWRHLTPWNDRLHLGFRFNVAFPWRTRHPNNRDSCSGVGPSSNCTWH